MGPVQLLSDGELSRAYEVRVAAHHAAAARDPFAPFEQWEALIRQPPAQVRRWHWLGDGTYAGVTGHGTATTAAVELVVHPAARRRGRGAALLADVCQTSRHLGYDRLITQFADPAGRRFALTHGAIVGNSTVRSVLSLPTDLHVRTVPGYAIASWINHTPDDLLASYTTARNAVNDAPRTDADAELWTPARVRNLEDVVVRRGRQTRVTAAVHGGRVVAFTELRTSPQDGAVASTEDTATLSEHRGQGLATWIKAVSIIRLQQDRPDICAIATSNDATNIAMLTVNHRIGFRPVATWTDAVLVLSATAPGQTGLQIT